MWSGVTFHLVEATFLALYAVFSLDGHLLVECPDYCKFGNEGVWLGYESPQNDRKYPWLEFQALGPGRSLNTAY